MDAKHHPDALWSETVKQISSPEPQERPADPAEIKLAINNLLWMHGPGNLTLAEAEHRALEILELVMRQPKACG